MFGMFEKKKERHSYFGGRGEIDCHEVGEVARTQIMQSHKIQGKGHGCHAKCTGGQWRDLNLVVTCHYLLCKRPF